MGCHLLNPLDISTAPELAVLALLHAAVDMSIRALLAAYPELNDTATDEPPCQAIARSILITASQLTEPLQAYRKARADAEIASASLPF